MNLKRIPILLFTLPIFLQAQIPISTDDYNIVPITYYYVRIQQQLTPSDFKVVDSISKIGLEVYPKWLKNVFGALKEGMIKVYSDAEGSQEIYHEDLNTILYRRDTVLTINPKTLEEEIKVFTSEITYKDITLIKFCEQWSWDALGHLTRKTVAYAPVIERDGAEPMRTLFWIKQEE